MKQSENRMMKTLSAVIFAIMFAVTLGLFTDHFGMVSLAATGTVTKPSINIRKEPSTSSTAVGSAFEGDKLTINSQTTGSDGKVWYQVVVDANTTGYVRSDLVTVSGDVPGGTGNAGNTGNTGTNNNAPTTANPSVPVTDVQPVSAKVTGGQAVRVRADANTNDANNIMTQLQKDTSVTVVGQATGTDGNTWYLVEFALNGTTTKGFIRSDYLTLSGSVVPVDTTPSTEPEASEPPSTQEDDPPVTDYSEDYELYWGRGSNEAADAAERWWIIDYTDPSTPYEYPVADLIKYGNAYYSDSQSSKGTINTQRVVIILLVILLVAVVLGATLLIFKMKDMNDDAYFSKVERDTIRERNAIRKERDAQNPARRPEGQRTVSPNRESRPGTARPQGTAGQRPAGSQPRPAAQAGSQARPAAQTAAQSRSAQPRPAAPAGSQPRPATSVGSQPRPAQPAAQSRPAASQNATVRPAVQSGAQSARPAADRPRPAAAPSSVQSVNSQQKPAQDLSQKPNGAGMNKSPLQDDDEFEFEFLNWDGEDNS